MSDKLTVKSPWTMVWLEYVDDFIRQIKEALPPDHELQAHELFPGIKMERRPIFIVEDDTTGQSILMDFEKRKRWKKTKHKVPTIRIFQDTAEIAALIERDHQAECAMYRAEETPT